MTQNSEVKIWFSVDKDDWHEKEEEGLFGQSLGDGKYKIVNSPWFAFNISWGDVVSVIEEDGKFFFDRVIDRGGHSTYRILPEDDVTPENFKILWDLLLDSGVTFEAGNDPCQIFSIDVPPDIDMGKVYPLLILGEEANAWEFEEGHDGHGYSSKNSPQA